MPKINLYPNRHMVSLTSLYKRYNLSFRGLVEMMKERGLSMIHTTIMRGTLV
ncbi:MAG TPA: hypothetical protein VEY51_17260 [Chondromyces sp.]|nr:hypothetical protein [Chondromyces sp.]